MNEKEYDFSQGKRGPVIPLEQGKTRITIRIDTDVLNFFRNMVHEAGGGNYQTLINAALREFIEGRHQNKILEDTVRKVIKEELQQTPCAPLKRRKTRVYAGKAKTRASAGVN